MAKSKKKPTPDNSAKAETPPFDLRIERWIPVVRLDGTRDEINLVEALLQAPQLREISDPLPTVEFGLYRLLVALVLDIFAPGGLTGLRDLRATGSFDEARVREYLFEKYGDRFDLFHREFPFLQSPGMDAESAKPLAGLLHPIPSGTNANHFHHGHESDFGVCPAAAARLLTTIAPFTTAGGAGLSPSINGSPPWYVLPRGRYLFETLCLNVPADLGLFRYAIERSSPAWGRTKPVTPDRRTEAGLVESLTWQPRRIQLLAGESGTCSLSGRESQTLVRTMRFTAGFGAGFPWTDPNAGYVFRSDDIGILRPQEDRAVWRDTGPLLLLRQADYSSEDGKIRFERPAVVTQFVTMLRDRRIQRSDLKDVVAYGMRTDMKMKVFEWQRETLSLPQALEWGSMFLGTAQSEIQRSDGVAYALKQAVKRAYPRDGAGNSNAYGNLIARVQNDFWDALHPCFNDLLEAISQAADDASKLAASTQWRKRVESAAWRSLDDGIDDLDNDSDAIERVANARGWFAFKLKSLLFPEQIEQAKDRKKKPATATAS